MVVVVVVVVGWWTTMSHRCDRDRASGFAPGNFPGRRSRRHRPTRRREPSGQRANHPDFRGARVHRRRHPCPDFPDCRFRPENGGRRSPCGNGRRRGRLGPSDCRRPRPGSAHRSRVGALRWIRRYRRSSEGWRARCPRVAWRHRRRDGRRRGRLVRCCRRHQPNRRRRRATTTGATAGADCRRGELAGSRAHRSAPGSTAGRGGGRHSQLDVAAAGGDPGGRRPDVERHHPDEGDEDDGGTREDATGSSDADDEAL